MNKKLTFLGIGLWIAMTLTSCAYYSSHGYYPRDDDRHWHQYDRGHYDQDPHGWGRRLR